MASFEGFLREVESVQLPIWSRDGVHFESTNIIAKSDAGQAFGRHEFELMHTKCTLPTVFNECYKKSKPTVKRIQFKVMKVQVRIFDSGAMISLGGATEKEAMDALHLVADNVNSCFSENVVNMKDFNVSNIVGKVIFPNRLCMSELYQQLVDLSMGQVTWVKEELPSCVTYKQDVTNNRHVTLRIFHTGSVVLLGAPTQEAVCTVLDSVYPALKLSPMFRIAPSVHSFIPDATDPKIGEKRKAEAFE